MQIEVKSYRILPCVRYSEAWGEGVDRPAAGQSPEFWGLYACLGDGTSQWLSDHKTERAAHDRATVLQAELDAAPSYRARYYASGTYRRARRRERRADVARAVLSVAFFLFIAFALAHVGAAIFRSL